MPPILSTEARWALLDERGHAFPAVLAVEQADDLPLLDGPTLGEGQVPGGVGAPLDGGVGAGCAARQLDRPAPGLGFGLAVADLSFDEPEAEGLGPLQRA